MQGKQPEMLEIVAVGAIAIVFELRMPCEAIRERSVVQSSDSDVSTST